MSYSQTDEERYILQAVGPKPGRFLDIGAFHAMQLSNTRALYERGWSGVLIEPSPEPFLGLLREYGNDPRITLISGAVARDRSILRLHCSSDALTTGCEENFERWKEVGGFFGVFHVPTITVPEILNQFGAFDMVSIDAEGSSVEIFECLLATAMRPRCICVEHDGEVDSCAAAAALAGYRATYISSENVVLSS